jgi:glycosyltransferase involved in cell wall biosynthesis
MTVRVAHVIPGLPIGGAEKALLNIATAARSLGVESEVVCLRERGPVSDMLDSEGIPTHHLGMRSVWRFPGGLAGVNKLLRKMQPDVIQGWLYHGNLAALLASRKTNAAVAWNVRQSMHRMDLFKATTRLTIKANAILSNRVDSIIYNSQASRQQHEASGFSASSGQYIPNGVDISKFSADAHDHSALRHSLGIADDEILVIAVGRAHSIKGYDVLLRTIGLVADTDVKARFLIVGRGVNWQSGPFLDSAADASIRDRTTLMEERDDIVELLAAADIFVSSSVTEGFPNAVAEAMALGLPCIVTDVGDSRALLGGFGEIAAAGDAAALAQGVLKLAGTSVENRHDMGSGARSRIENEFSLGHIAQRYADHYHQLASKARRPENG